MTEAHPIDRLFAVIQSRKTADPASSYTAKLFSRGTLQIAKKLGEEGVETALAAVGQDREHVIAESADLLYHLLVLWAARDIAPGTNRHGRLYRDQKELFVPVVWRVGKNPPRKINRDGVKVRVPNAQVGDLILYL